MLPLKDIYNHVSELKNACKMLTNFMKKQIDYKLIQDAVALDSAKYFVFLATSYCRGID